MPDIDKVVCYVTRGRGEGMELLTFTKPDDPSAGTQVPAGTVDAGEAFADAAVRELAEESGLTNAPLLGQIDARSIRNPASGNLHIRRVYHFDGSAIARDEWDHIAGGDSDERGQRFRLRFLPLTQARAALRGYFDHSIDALLRWFDHKPLHRPATRDDLRAINDIYNHYVSRSTCTYQEIEETMADRQAWFENRSERHPVTVMELAGEVVAWGSLNVFRARSAYRFSTENSVYVRHDLIGAGLGRMILADQIAAARRLGYRTIIAGIDAEQAGSIRLHEQFGFVNDAILRQVGRKFDRWLDVAFMQKLL
jgi:phosphinothricin acetyltransferase